MKILDKEQFANDFIKVYNQKGFGSMNKSDFEILLFNLLKKYGNLKGMSKHEMSLELQIPESKIRRLDYESELKYASHNETQMKADFLAILSKSKLRADLNKIEFIIESQFLRSSISAKLKELGHYDDGSFNAEIIKIHYESFIDLITYLLPKEEIETIVKECKKQLPKSKDQITFKGLLKKYLESMASEAGKKTIEIGSAIISGGTSLIGDLVKTIKSN